MAKLKVELNDPNVIKDLLQEAYMLSNEQIVQAQNEINRMVNATQLQNEVMDSKTKFAKAINDYLGVKDKAIAKKVEIAKLLTEIFNSCKNSAAAGMDTSVGVKQSLDLNKIKEMVKSMHEDKEKTKTIELTKK
jgi:hypothetical protein